MKRHEPVFVITFGRPTQQHTLRLLSSSVNSRDVYLVCDNTDPTLKEYQRLHRNVIVFDRERYIQSADHLDNFGAPYRTTTHARNAVQDIAAGMGASGFLVLDDDYTELATRFRPTRGQRILFKSTDMRSKFDSLVDMSFELLYSVENMAALCWAQNADFAGGIHAKAIRTQFLRKAMNVWFMHTSRPVRFWSRLNEDVVTCLAHPADGRFFFTTSLVAIRQFRTQMQPGGMTEAYRAQGTYQKSMYAVLARPDCVSLSILRGANRRVHHRVDWKFAVPAIVAGDVGGGR